MWEVKGSVMEPNEGASLIFEWNLDVYKWARKMGASSPTNQFQPHFYPCISMHETPLKINLNEHDS